jgi:hypothetical protein
MGRWGGVAQTMPQHSHCRTHLKCASMGMTVDSSRQTRHHDDATRRQTVPQSSGERRAIPRAGSGSNHRNTAPVETRKIPLDE